MDKVESSLSEGVRPEVVPLCPPVSISLWLGHPTCSLGAAPPSSRVSGTLAACLGPSPLGLVCVFTHLDIVPDRNIDPWKEGQQVSRAVCGGRVPRLSRGTSGRALVGHEGQGQTLLT